MISILLGLALAMPAQPPKATVRATYYGDAYQGRSTAAGAHKSKAVPFAHWRFDKNAFTAAHNLLPFGTSVRVKYRGRSVDVMITDRGPTHGGIDLSEAAFAVLAPTAVGVLTVELEVLNASR